MGYVMIVPLKIGVKWSEARIVLAINGNDFVI
jgi:hypothetical protein